MISVTLLEVCIDPAPQLEAGTPSTCWTVSPTRVPGRPTVDMQPSLDLAVGPPGDEHRDRFERMDLGVAAFAVREQQHMVPAMVPSPRAPRP